MEIKNEFDNNFDQVSESHKQMDEIRAKTIRGVVDLNEARKVYNNKQKILTETELETCALRKSNQELKKLLMKTLIEKEELTHRRLALESNVKKTEAFIQELEVETDLYLVN